MEVIVEQDAGGLARRAADVVGEYLTGCRDPVLGLATGGSVRRLYRELTCRFRQGRLSLGGAQAFLLDEYVGLEAGHPQRYANVVRRQFAEHVDLDPGRIHSPDGNAADLDRECARYDRQIIRAQVGLQILGIGRNGHLAFNEPGSSFESRTRVVQLTSVTRADNARFFDSASEVPFKAITQGLATILQAGRLLVVATGPHKAEAVRASLRGPVSPAVPASAIRLHPRVTVILDPLAARFTRLVSG